MCGLVCGGLAISMFLRLGSLGCRRGGFGRPGVGGWGQRLGWSLRSGGAAFPFLFLAIGLLQVLLGMFARRGMGRGRREGICISSPFPPPLPLCRRFLRRRGLRHTPASARLCPQRDRGANESTHIALSAPCFSAERIQRLELAGGTGAS